MLTSLPATPDVASLIVGLRVTGPRHVPGASPAGPLEATEIVGPRVSILSVRCSQGSRMPALSVAR